MTSITPTPADQDTAPTRSATDEIPYPSCQVPSAEQVQNGNQRGGLASALLPRRWRPYSTWVILSLNILVWAADLALGLVLGTVSGRPVANPLLLLGVKSNELILLGQTWRLITPVFLHVGLMHLAFNSYAIYMIGPQIECFFGPQRFLSIYLLSGFYGVLFSFALSPAPSAGASGAIFGLIGTQAVFFFRYRNAFGERGRRQLYSTLTVIVLNMVLTFSAPGIDIWGHVGGLLVGAVLGWGLTPRYALAHTEGGSVIVDLNRPRRWALTVAGAIAVLIVGTVLTIVVQTAGI